MQFKTPLIQGTLQKRYKRFLTDVTLPGDETVVAHCANSGSMLGLTTPGVEVWLSASDNPARALKYSWELVRAGEALVGLNTSAANTIVHEGLLARAFTEVAAYSNVRREVKYGTNSRVDFLLEEKGLPPCYLEVKNVTLKRLEALEFPDSVTERGAKHMRELAEMAKQGARAVVLFLAQRNDGDVFSVAEDIDPAYATAFRDALACGVEAICYKCEVTPEAVTITVPVPIMKC